VSLFSVRPRLTRESRSLRVLKSATTAQAFLAVAVVLAVGFLISLDPARQALAVKEANQSGISVTQSPAALAQLSSKTGMVFWAAEISLILLLVLPISKLARRFGGKRSDDS
jgi:hypothetical protein